MPDAPVPPLPTKRTNGGGSAEEAAPAPEEPADEEPAEAEDAAEGGDEDAEAAPEKLRI